MKNDYIFQNKIHLGSGTVLLFLHISNFWRNRRYLHSLISFCGQSIEVPNMIRPLKLPTSERMCMKKGK